MPTKDDVTLTLTRTEALALGKAAETELRVIEVLSLVPNTTAMEKALNLLRGAT